MFETTVFFQRSALILSIAYYKIGNLHEKLLGSGDTWSIVSIIKSISTYTILVAIVDMVIKKYARYLLHSIVNVFSFSCLLLTKTVNLLRSFLEKILGKFRKSPNTVLSLLENFFLSPKLLVTKLNLPTIALFGRIRAIYGSLISIF